MIFLYTAIIFPAGIVFIFTEGILFAIRFVGTAMLPCIAMAGLKWGVLMGDRQQKIGVPLVAVLLLAFSYWLSNGVSIQIFGHHLSGFVLALIGAFIGLTGIPLSWAGPAPPHSN
jgi:hypothetical protein